MTQRIIAVRVFAMACATLLLEQPGVAERPLFVDPSVLEFSVQTDRKVYQLEDDVRLTYRFKNRSDYPVLIPKGPPSCGVFVGIEVEFQDSTGKEPEKTLAGDCFRVGPDPTPLEQAKGQSSVVLGKGSFIGAEEEIFTGLYRNLKPGQYKIVVTLRSWSPGDFNAQDREELARRYSRVLTGTVEQVVWVRLERRRRDVE